LQETGKKLLLNESVIEKKEKADKIFVESKYSQLLKVLSDIETYLAFEKPNEASGK
jgi:hypothetical protein